MPLYSSARAGRNLRFVSGRYYPIVTGGVVSNGTATQSRLRLIPFFADEPMTFDRIGSVVQTAAAGSTLRWAAWTDNNGVPGTLLLDTGAVGDSATTGFKEATISLSLSGKHWIGVLPQGGNPTFYGVYNASVEGIGFADGNDVNGNQTAMSYYMDGITGAVPGAFTVAGLNSSAPQVYLRKA